MNSPQRILVVEDEPLIAMMLEDFLEILEKQVAGTADNVASALALVQEGGVDGGGIDAAILDVNLRGGEKSTLVADALAQRGVPFVFATGGSEDGVVAEHRDRPRLQKPFTMDGVSKALEGL